MNKFLVKEYQIPEAISKFSVKRPLDSDLGNTSLDKLPKRSKTTSSHSSHTTGSSSGQTNWG